MSNALPLGTRGKHAVHVDAFVRQLRPGLAAIRSSYDLAVAIGVNQRAVGYIARDARLEGHAVGSAHGHGYYLIETEAERAATIAHLESRARGILDTVKALRNASIVGSEPRSLGTGPAETLWDR